MSKDWERCEIRFSDSDSLIRTTTETMYGGSYLNSPFAEISKREEAIYFHENINIEHENILVDDFSNYLQDREFNKIESTRELVSIVCQEYKREFYEWMERGFRLWTIYPASKPSSPIVQLWSEEIKLIRQEFKLRVEAVIPF